MKKEPSTIYVYFVQKHNNSETINWLREEFWNEADDKTQGKWDKRITIFNDFINPEYKGENIQKQSDLWVNVFFQEYKYNDDKKIYEYSSSLPNKILNYSTLESILSDKQLDTKEKLLEILKDKNLIDGDISEYSEFDFLRDKDSVVYSKKSFEGKSKKLHEIIHITCLAREINREFDELIKKWGIDDASVSENVEQEEETIDFSKTNKKVMKM